MVGIPGSTFWLLFFWKKAFFLASTCSFVAETFRNTGSPMDSFAAKTIGSATGVSTSIGDKLAKPYTCNEILNMFKHEQKWYSLGNC